MKLADNDTFSTVYYKGAFFSHQRDCTKVDFLLLDIADIGDSRFFLNIIHHQPYGDTKGDLICHPPVNTFLHTVLNRSKPVRYKFK